MGEVLLLALVFAALTWLVSWVMVPAAAFVWGWLRSQPARMPLVAGALSWGLLLLVQARDGSLPATAARVAGVFQLHPLVLTALTLVFPALLAWAAARLGTALRTGIAGKRSARVAD